MLQAASEGRALVQVPASPEVIARRHEAAHKAGVPITAALSFDWVPAPKEPKERTARDHLGMYKAQDARPLRDVEWQTIADLLPDAPNAKLTYRRFLNDMLKYVVQGWSWRDLSFGATVYPASRERVRRRRGSPVWAQVAARAELWGDHEMVSHMQRVCQWLTDPSRMELLAVVPQRQLRTKAQLAAWLARKVKTQAAN